MKWRLHALRIGVTVLSLALTSIAAVASPYYVIKKGDTLYSLARRYKVPLGSLKQANGVTSRRPLRKGSQLVLPSLTKKPLDKKLSEKKPSGKKPLVLAEAIQPPKQIVMRFGPRVARELLEQARLADAAWVPRPEVVRTALTYRGSRYVRGGTGRRGFDCSGFTRYVFAKYGASLPHCSKAQANCGKLVPRDQLQPGDLVFFHTRRGGISHVGIFVGENKFIHASTPRHGVILSSMDEPYYASRFRCARRMKLQE